MSAPDRPYTVHRDGPRMFLEPPNQPTIVYLMHHDHEWWWAGAHLEPNGTWSSLWRCTLCPDIGKGGRCGPVPDGYCPCGWVNRGDGDECQECGRTLYRQPPEGWYDFGTLVESDEPLEFSDELGEDGLPLWERPAVEREQ